MLGQENNHTTNYAPVNYIAIIVLSVNMSY